MSSSGLTPSPAGAAAGRPLPDFVIIGAAKSATSLLASYLKRHPRIFFSPIKEPLFFAYEHLYGQGFASYRELFAGARADQLCGEGSTDYTRFPQVTGVPERLAAANPRARLIYVMRHPVDRAYSHYVHRYTKELHRGEPFRATFEEHVKTDPMCMDSSLYALQLDQYLKHFSLDAILPLATEDFRATLPATLSRCYRFLGVEDLPGDPPELDPEERNEADRFLNYKLIDQANAPLRKYKNLRRVARALVPEGARKRLYELMLKTPRGKRLQQEFTPPPLPAEERQRLIAYFEPHNQRLEQMIGRSFPAWRS